jgi:hypothetical protein
MLYRIRWQQTVLAFTAAAFVGLLAAANTGPITRLKLDPVAEVVPLFVGRDDGRFEVRMAAINAHQANVVITNMTPGALTVALPKAAVGVHVLPQFNNNTGFLGQQGNFPFGQPQGQPPGGNGDMAAINNVAQSTGGSMNPVGVLNGPGNGPTPNPFGFPSIPAEWSGKPDLAAFGGFATIPAGKAIQLQMRTVCLHYGRPEPNPKMTYRLTSVEEFTTDPVLAALLQSYSLRTEKDAMQAAAWHVASDMPWKQLAGLPKSGLVATSAKLFNRRDMADAESLVEQATAVAKTEVASRERLRPGSAR